MPTRHVSAQFRTVAAVSAIATLAAMPSTAHANRRWFAYVYDWQVPYRFEREVEVWWTQDQRGNALGQIEYEYGVDGRLAIAPYVLFEKEGDKTRLQGWKLETRYSFGEYATNRFLSGTYLELAKERDEPYEIEGKYIGTYESSSGWVWAGNLIAEQKIKGGQTTEWGYATAIGKPISNNLHVGIEAFGNWLDKAHWVGPSAGLATGPRSQVLAAVGFSTNKKGNQFRLLYEIEF